MEKSNEIDIYLLLFAGTLVMFLLAGSVVLFIYLYRKRLTRQQIDMQDMHTRLQQDILNNHIEMLETERKRFAEDLHDEIGGKLSALRLNLAQLQKNRNDTDNTQVVVTRSKEIIDSMIVMVRRVSHNILPPSLEMFGLANAVEELCSWINTSSSLTVKMDCQLDSVTLDQQKQLALYRIIQELFSNTIKHAQADTICLTLAPNKKELQLIYKDNGKGYNPLQNGSKGMGFRNINNRVKAIKGKIIYPQETTGFSCVIDFSAS